jgi:hypothetical protein
LSDLIGANAIRKTTVAGDFEHDPPRIDGMECAAIRQQENDREPNCPWLWSPHRKIRMLATSRTG